MKKIISLMILLTGIRAQADFIKWNVGAVQGRIQTFGSLALEDAQAVLYCQYCNVGTCAGGPSKQTDLKTRLVPVAEGEFHLVVDEGHHFSGYPLKSLSRCGYYLTLAGYDRQSGNIVRGEISLAYSGRRDANPIWKDPKLAATLTESLLKRPLKLEIRKKGIANPGIYPIESN